MSDTDWGVEPLMGMDLRIGEDDRAFRERSASDRPSLSGEYSGPGSRPLGYHHAEEPQYVPERGLGGSQVIDWPGSKGAPGADSVAAMPHHREPTPEELMALADREIQSYRDRITLEEGMPSAVQPALDRTADSPYGAPPEWLQQYMAPTPVDGPDDMKYRYEREQLRAMRGQ